MSSIFDLILDNNRDDLSSFLESSTSCDWGKSGSGRTAIQLAFHKGRPLLCGLIASEYSNLVNEIEWTLKDLVQGIVEEFSEESLCSSWSEGVEFELWEILKNEFDFSQDDRMDIYSDAVKKRILKLAKIADSWPYWGDESSKIEHLDLDEWNALYGNWRENQLTKGSC